MSKKRSHHTNDQSPDGVLLDAAQAMLDQELGKPDGEIDHDLVMECTAYIDELCHGDPYTLDEDKLAERLAHIRRASRQASKHPRRFTLLRPVRVAVAAALVVVLAVSSFTVGAQRAEMRDLIDYSADALRELFALEPGSYDVPGGTITIGENSVMYDSLEAFLTDTQMDVLLPTWLPEKVEVKNYWAFYYEDCHSFCITTTAEGLYISGRNKYLSKLETVPDTAETLRVDDKLYYLATIEETGQYQALTQYEGYEYAIVYTDYETVLNIARSMKKGVTP